MHQINTDLLPLICHSSPFLGGCPLSQMHHHPLGAWCLICWSSCSGVCWGQRLSSAAGFPGGFCTSSEKTLLWELHVGLALTLTSPSTCWMDACLSLLKAQSTLWSETASLQAAENHKSHVCFFRIKQVPWHSSRSSQKSLAIPGVHRLIQAEP